MQEVTMKQKFDSVHPLSWWLLGISISISSALSVYPYISPLICVLTLSIIALANRDAATGNLGFGFYLLLALAVVVSRLVFKIIFNIEDPTEPTLLALPSLEINLGFGDPVEMLGNVSMPSMMAAAGEGVRLAAIILGIALAVTLAEPKKLLRSTPAALLEIGATVSMAVNLVPQLIKSYKRVKQAQRLRGKTGKINALTSTVIPVIEDAVESSLKLAASMSSRGFGLQVNSQIRLLTGLLSLVSVICISYGSYLLIAVGSGFLWLLFVGLCLALTSMWIASRAAIRTKYVATKFNKVDGLVSVAALAVVLATAVGRIAQ